MVIIHKINAAILINQSVFCMINQFFCMTNQKMVRKPNGFFICRRTGFLLVLELTSSLTCKDLHNNSVSVIHMIELATAESNTQMW